MSTRTEVAPDFPSVDVEWHLVAALLTHGITREWADRYCSDVCTPTGIRTEEEVAQWLCRQYDVSVEVVVLLHRVVRSNAFGLESTLLGVEYGAVFYETACKFNHSCDPNCLSIRIAGNMAIFTCTTIRAGTELRHSYLPARLLVLPRTFRASHLHFACACPRCAKEQREQSTATSLDAMGFPPGHANTAEGLEVAAFKLAAASGEASVILQQGCKVLQVCEATLVARPLAALEVSAPLLAAYGVVRLSGVGAGEADATVDVEAAVLMAARLQAWATEAIRRVYEGSDAPAFAEALADMALITYALLLHHGGDNGPGEAKAGALHRAALCALRRCSARFGGSLEWMRDDLPCFCSDCSVINGSNSPPLLVQEALATMCPVGARPGDVTGLAAAAGLALVSEDSHASTREGRGGATRAKPKLEWTFIGDTERLDVASMLG